MGRYVAKSKVKKIMYKRKKALKKAMIPRGVSTSTSASFKGGAFPKKLKTTLRYTTVISLASAGATQSYQFSANGIFDPDLTGGGAQPLYFDQLMGIYDHYTVIGSKIKYTIVPNGNGLSQAPYRITTWINDDTVTAGTNMDAIAQQIGSKTRICNGGLNPDKIIVSNKWSAKKWFGGSILANNDLQGDASKNPTESSVFQLTYRAIDGVSTPTFYVLVEILYVTVFQELKDILAS